MTVEEVIQTIRDDHGGAWYMLFRVNDKGHKFLPTGHVLTAAAYRAVVRAFAPEEPVPSAAQRKVNALRYRAESNHG